MAIRKGKSEAAQPNDMRWWLPIYEGRRWQVVTKLQNDLRAEQRGRLQEELLYMALYSGREPMGYALQSYWQTQDRYADSNRLGVNLCKNAVNAIVSKIGKDRPRPTCTTDDGDWGAVMRAEQLQRFLDGSFYSAGVYEVDQLWLLRACNIGTSHLKIFRTDDPTDEDDEANIEVEVVLPGSIIVDDYDAITGKPRSIQQVYPVDKNVLAEQYDDAELKAKILKAPQPSDRDSTLGYNRKTNQIIVTESWHLPSGPKAKDGRHTITIDGADLRDEEYKRDKFPFVKLIYDDEPVGYWGCGIGFQAWGYQSEINNLLLKSQRILQLAAVPHVFVDTASMVNVDTMTNEIMTIWEYSGSTPPTVITPQNLIGDLMKQASLIREWFYQDLGISQMMAQSEKPPGVDAAVAIEALADADSERHIRLGRRWEAAHMEVAEHFIDLAEEINEGDPKRKWVKKDYAVTFRGEDTMAKLKWSDVNMDRDAYVLQVTPSSALGNTVGGRIKRGSELLKLGALGIDEFIEVTNIGDVKRATAKRIWPRRYIGKVIEQIVKHGNYIGPEPDDNKELAAEMVLTALQRAKTTGVKEERLQLLRDYLLELKGPNPTGAEAGVAMPTLAPGLGMPGTPGMLPPGPPPGMPPMPGGAPPPMPQGGAPPGAMH